MVRTTTTMMIMILGFMLLKTLTSFQPSLSKKVVGKRKIVDKLKCKKFRKKG